MDILKTEVSLDSAVVGENEILGARCLFLIHSFLDEHDLADTSKESEVGGAVTQTRLPPVHSVLTESETLHSILINDVVVAILDL